MTAARAAAHSIHLSSRRAARDFPAMPFEFLKSDSAALLKQPGLCTAVRCGKATLHGTRSTLKRQDAATLTGAMYHYDFSILIPAGELESLASVPEPLRDSLTVDGAPHLILASERDIAGNMRFHLGAQYG